MNWYVLFVQTLYEDKLCKQLNKQDDIFVFSAKLEYFRKDRNQIELKSLFPGYIFIKAELNQDDFNDWLRKQDFKKGFIKELKHQEISALTPEEIQLFDMLLDKQGVMRMSYGNLVNSKLVICDGPLTDFGDYIVKYDRRNRLATLDLFFLNKQWMAGVTVLENKEA